MKLKLTKQWYEARAKAEEGCLDFSAGASGKTVTVKNILVTSSKASRKTGNATAKKSVARGKSRRKSR